MLYWDCGILPEDIFGNTSIKLKIQSDYNRNIIDNNSAMFSLKGADMVTNKYVGVGGLDGRSSGEVASPVAGSKRIIWGYASIAVFNPYRSAILREI